MKVSLLAYSALLISLTVIVGCGGGTRGTGITDSSPGPTIAAPSTVILQGKIEDVKGKALPDVTFRDDNFSIAVQSNQKGRFRAELDEDFLDHQFVIESGSFSSLFKLPKEITSSGVKVVYFIVDEANQQLTIAIPSLGFQRTIKK